MLNIANYGITSSQTKGINYPGWNHGLKFTIPANLVDANEQNIPIPVYLNSSNFDFSKCKPDGSDIRFTDKNLNPLKFERVEHTSYCRIPNMVSNTSPFGVASAGSVYGGTENPAYKAFNTDGTSVWASAIGSPLSSCWLQYEFPEPVVVIEQGYFESSGYTDMGTSPRTVTVTLSGSNDGSSFTPLTTFAITIVRTGNNGFGSFEGKAIDNKIPYRYYRWTFSGFTHESSYPSQLVIVSSCNLVTTGTASFAHYNVLIPSVSDLQDTEFYMWYGNENAYNDSIEAWQDMTGKQLTYNGNVKLVPIPDAMRIATSTTGTDLLYFNKSNIVTQGKTTVAVGRLKIEAAVGKFSSSTMSVEDGTKAIRMTVTTAGIVVAPYTAAEQFIPRDTTSAYYDYMIKVNGTENVEFWANSSLLATIPYSSFGTNTNQIYFGDGSNDAGEGGSTLWKSMKYNLDYTADPDNFVEWNPLKGLPSANGWTATGTASLASLITEEYTGRMASFDGNGDYLNVSYDASIDMYNQSFCREYLYIPSVVSGIMMLDSMYATSNKVEFYIDHTNRVIYFDVINSGSNTCVGFGYPSAFVPGHAYHIELDRIGNTLYCFINGAQVDSAKAFSVTLPVLGTPWRIGDRYNHTSHYYLNGYLAGIRWTKGRARNISSFVPPTKFDIDGDDVVFCTNFDTIYDQNYAMVQHMGDTLVDATGNGNNGTATGTTVVNTEFGKALSFNGSSDYVGFSSVVTPIGAKTVLSMQISKNATGYYMIQNCNGSGESSADAGLDFNSTGSVTLRNGTTNVFQLLANPVNTLDCFHVNAISWDGTTGTNKARSLRDGVLLTTATANVMETKTPQNNLLIGKRPSGSYSFYGVMNEVRMSNIARSDAWIKIESLGLLNQLLTASSI